MKTDIDKLLEQALKSDLPMQMPGDFARKVVTVYARRKAWRQHLHEFIIYASVILSCLATGLAIVYFFGTERWQEWSQFFYSNYAFLAVILLLALFILFADKVILPLLFIMGKKKKDMDVSY